MKQYELIIPRDFLQFAAQELNEQIGLQPPIPLDADDDEIRELLLDAAVLVEPDDLYSALTWFCMGFQDDLFSKELSEEHGTISV
jgi:hypothetical protein